MIITELKPIDEMLQLLAKHKKIFLVGCGSCAEQCHTGGQDDVLVMKKKLEQAGKEIIGWQIPDETCHLPLVKRDFRKIKESISKADAVLVMACGAGVRTVVEATSKRVYPALNTLSLGTTERKGSFIGRCALCGECVLGLTAGICPIAICPKGILNGPCGGVIDGKCEINLDDDCVWVKIYEVLKVHNDTDSFKKIRKPKDHSKNKRQKRIKVERRSDV